MHPFDSLPLWAFFTTVLLLSLLWTECGYRVGGHRRKKDPKEPDAPLGTVVASILGLLAFMLGFTFNVAINRFDDRREAVLDEANAIGTTYLRADFFDSPAKEQARKLLREYVQLRANGVRRAAEFEQVVSRSEQLQSELWSSAAKLGKERPTPISGLYISSLNEVIDMHAKRITLGMHSRVPLSVWLVLFAVSALAMASVGFYFGLSGNRSWVETIVLIVTFSLVMLLVADLDRPQEGLIRASQQPMLDLQKQLGPP
ncbi:hypothetical protein KBI23_11950 [bacterium]|nr:hypothetical protein [bacterium]MBP9808635.1 hypothetical protein [bacterium]